MKFSFDLDEIEEISKKWFYILDMNVELQGKNHANMDSLDERDMQYIASVMDREANLSRLMPTIIKEAFQCLEDDLEKLLDLMERQLLLLKNFRS